jgi:Tfp pilus assembly protein PilF
MKNFNFTVTERNVMGRSSPLIALALIIAATLMIGNQTFADETRFRVLFENVPGAEEIKTGNIQAGIKMLEDRLSQVEQEKSGDVWSTLCAAYVSTISLKQAKRACNKAVKIDPSYLALNNRGVFHLAIGDFTKAREDFDRARPLNEEASLDRIKTENARLVAARNFDLLKKKMAEHTPPVVRASGVIRTAAIEDIID